MIELNAEEVSVNIEGGFDVFDVNGVVDGWYSTGFEKSAVNFTRAAFLVMTHESKKLVIVVASDAECSVVRFHEARQCIEVLAGEAF